MIAHRDRIIIIFGPTTVGKSALAERCASEYNGEIINMDMGQLYAPLTIGTAKPQWQTTPFQQHMFDVIDTPRCYTAIEYRARVQAIVFDILSRGKRPIFVGGCGFYLQALFFWMGPRGHGNKQQNLVSSHELAKESHNYGLWEKLYSLDPERARAIHANDIYRIERALAIWEDTGIRPSVYREFTYCPIGSAEIFFVTMERSRLYDRINRRVEQMIAQGWLDEVDRLRGTPWEAFLLEKKIIGYNELLRFLADSSSYPLNQCIEDIQQRTRRYAKRQECFGRMLKKRFAARGQDSSPGSADVFTHDVSIESDWTPENFTLSKFLTIP